MEDGHGKEGELFFPTARSLHTGRQVDVEAVGRRTRRGRENCFFRLRGHFTLEGHLKLMQLEDGHGKEVENCFFRLRGHFTLEGHLKLMQLEDGHGEEGRIVFPTPRSLHTGRPLEVEAVGIRTR